MTFEKSSRTVDHTFDTIIIGSSPILLIEALYLEAQGCRVAIFEKGQLLGGAWYTKALWGYRTVEMGCHYIDRRERAYFFLKEFLGLELEPQARHVLWQDTGNDPGRYERTGTIRNGLRKLIEFMLMGRPMSRDFYDVLAATKEKDIKALGCSLRNLIIPQPYFYPVGGCKAMMEAFTNKINSTSITVLNNSGVESVTVPRNGKLCRCSVGGQRYFSREIVMGQHASARITVDGLALKQGTKPCNIHILFRIDGQKKLDFDYLDVARDDWLERVQDVTSYSRYQKESAGSEVLICCHLKEENVANIADPSEIFGYLIELGLLRENAKLLDSKIQVYASTSCIHNNELYKMEPVLNDSLRVMRTWDLGISIDYYYERWRSLIGAGE